MMHCTDLALQHMTVKFKQKTYTITVLKFFLFYWDKQSPMHHLVSLLV